nr:MAG TPA_asm: hypothetical protein [Bacteriophage sp.]DAP05579.1 MAG TPA: hypothetical protein [Caudoviricetes sp.]
MLIERTIYIYDSHIFKHMQKSCQTNLTVYMILTPARS